jgi:peroxiredoxin Q/BCP
MKSIGSKIDLQNLSIYDQKLGENILLSDMITLPAVIYFYPKDMTPGCTEEACSIRDFNHEISNLGYSVYGISSDPIESHEKFKSKHNLNFPLIADVDKVIHNAFGVWVEKNMYGKKYYGTLRSTFILDANGIVIATWGDDKSSSQGKVITKTHGEDILNFLKSL